MKKLLWIIPSLYDKQELLNVDLTKLKELANKFDFNVDFVLLASNKFLNENEDFQLDTQTKYTLKIYDSKVLLNTCIMKELENVDYDNVIVTYAKYTSYFGTMQKMIEAGSDENVNFVHLKHKTNGFFSEVVNFTSEIYNKIVKMFTGSKDKMFVQNCVMFNRVVLEIMQEYPNKSAIIKETSFLALTRNEIITVDKNFKKVKMKPNSLGHLISSIFMCAATIALFVVLCAVRMNLNMFIWLLMALIIMSVISLISLNYSILKDKVIINDFYLDSTKNITPLGMKVFNENKGEIQSSVEIDNASEIQTSEGENDTKQVVVEKEKQKKTSTKSKSTSKKAAAKATAKKSTKTSSTAKSSKSKTSSTSKASKTKTTTSSKTTASKGTTSKSKNTKAKSNAKTTKGSKASKSVE